MKEQIIAALIEKAIEAAVDLVNEQSDPEGAKAIIDLEEHQPFKRGEMVVAVCDGFMWVGRFHSSGREFFVLNDVFRVTQGSGEKPWMPEHLAAQGFLPGVQSFPPVSTRLFSTLEYDILACSERATDEFSRHLDEYAP